MRRDDLCIWTRFLGSVLLLLSTTALVQADDGKLVDSSLVQLENARPYARSVLDKVEIRSITFLSDGLKVKGYLAVPKEGKKLPCVIYNRGGNRSFGALNDEEAVYLLGRVATWGYVVAASQYRGVRGGEGKEEFGGADVDDVLNLMPLLESLPQADARRIGMYGWSRGGMMTYLALTRTDRIAAAVIGGGSSDLFDGLKQRPDMEKAVYAELIPNYAKDKEAALTARSAIRWPEKINKKTPLLLLHGGADWRVDPTEALAMVSALYKSKQPFRFVFFEGGDHGLSEYQGEVNRLTKDWLDHYVRDREPWPSLEPHGD
jgi:dipeptidyl aminopeptidase/acylaminoacyl peptidase